MSKKQLEIKTSDDTLHFRRASIKDIDLVYEWVNDREVRNNSFNSDPIPYDGHCAWFQKKLQDEDTVMLMYCSGQQPVGQVRLDYDENRDNYVISYLIAKEYRGQGYASRMLRLLEESVSECTLLAEVKEENIASVKVFEKLGYEKLGYEKRTDEGICIFVKGV